jgi:hypothetical protein
MNRVGALLSSGGVGSITFTLILPLPLIPVGPPEPEARSGPLRFRRAAAAGGNSAETEALEHHLAELVQPA